MHTDTSINYPREILERYWVFYRAEPRRGGPTATGCIKPLKLAVDILQKNTHLSDEELKDAIAASLLKLMRQIHRGTAEGRWVTGGNPEIELIQEFARFFIDEYFNKALLGDRARISGNKLALLEHTCEFLYRRKEDELRAEIKRSKIKIEGGSDRP